MIGVGCRVEGKDVDDTTQYMHCALETPSTGWNSEGRAAGGH